MDLYYHRLDSGGACSSRDIGEAGGAGGYVPVMLVPPGGTTGCGIGGVCCA